MGLHEHTRAFADHLLEEPEDFREANEKLATRICKGMIEENKGGDQRFTVGKIMGIIANARPEWRESLLTQALNSFFKSSRWPEFVRGVLVAVKEFGGEEEVFPPNYIRAFFDSPESFDALFNNRDLIGDEEHPLFSWIVCDRHWEETVLMRIARNDFLHAWDDVKRALGGWLSIQELTAREKNPKEYMESLGSGLNRRGRCLMASPPVAKKLLNQLFTEMCRGGLISEDQLRGAESSELYPWNLSYAYNRRTTPGLSYALYFAQLARAGEPLPQEYYMVLRIARYFSETKIERRKARRAKAKV